MKSKRSMSKWQGSSMSSKKLKSITSDMEKDKKCTDITGESLNPILPFQLLAVAKYLELGEARDKNFVFSPCSIQLALSLVASGSTGSTLKELLTFLDAKDLDHLTVVAEKLISSLVESIGGGIMLSFIGVIWIDHSLTLNPNFKVTAESIYHANAKVVDFQNKGDVIVDEANKWANQATNGLINSVLRRPLDPSIKLLLANALYFKGVWREKFNESTTKKSKFYLIDGGWVDVPFMSSEKDQFVTTFRDFKVLRLPYEKSDNTNMALSMYIILPHERDGLWSIAEKMGSDPSFLETYICSNTWKVKVGKFEIPKFKITFEFEASKFLKSTGLKLPFSDSAEFSEMVLCSESIVEKFKVSEVNHKSCIEVNEDGTEAAAVTIVRKKLMCVISGGSDPIDFVADHPFMFMARDDTSGIVFFMGHVMNPLL